MNTLQILIEARKLIEKPEGWTTDAYARDADNFDCDALSPRAKCFCMLGALARASNVADFRVVETEHALPLKQAVSGNIIAFNDAHTHAEVLAAFDRAIARASTESESHE